MSEFGKLKQKLEAFRLQELSGEWVNGLSDYLHAHLPTILVALEKAQRVEELLARLKRGPQGQECWHLHRDGGCRDCEGFGKVDALACGPKCRRTDHSHCAEKQVVCSECSGTGLGFQPLYNLCMEKLK